MASFQAVAYEYAIEMTYPLPEGTSSGLINSGSQVHVLYIRQCFNVCVWRGISSSIHKNKGCIETNLLILAEIITSSLEL